MKAAHFRVVMINGLIKHYLINVAVKCLFFKNPDIFERQLADEFFDADRCPEGNEQEDDKQGQGLLFISDKCIQVAKELSGLPQI